MVSGFCSCCFGEDHAELDEEPLDLSMRGSEPRDLSLQPALHMFSALFSNSLISVTTQAFLWVWRVS